MSMETDSQYVPLPGKPVTSPRRRPRRSATSGVEEEIARLTWLVIDGSATLEHRLRLAELVSMQHATRPANGEPTGST